MRYLLLATALMLSACSSSAPSDTSTPTESAGLASTEREAVTIPLSLHVMVEAGDPTSNLSSSRTPAELQEIADAMGEIWQQADVIFDPVNVDQIEVPTVVLQAILLGNTDAFFDQVNVTFAVPNGQAINGFYVPAAFGVNGFTPQGSNLFFVVDQPSVPDERVSSHEVGHIFGLHHDQDDPGRLMFSGTNGTRLTELEQTVARYGAQGLFPQGIEP